MKKKLFISLMIVSFFNYTGCYTYSALTEEEIKAGYPKPDEKIKILLKDSTEIECSSILDFKENENIYIKVDTTGHYVAGHGNIIDKKKGITTDFRGIISNGIDSSKEYTINSEQYSIFWTNNNKRISFRHGNFVHVLPERGTGYFISDPEGNQIKIPRDQISEISRSKINWYLTAPLLAVSIAAAVFFIISLEGLGNAFNFSSKYSR